MTGSRRGRSAVRRRPAPLRESCPALPASPRLTERTCPCCPLPSYAPPGPRPPPVSPSRPAPHAAAEVPRARHDAERVPDRPRDVRQDRSPLRGRAVGHEPAASRGQRRVPAVPVRTLPPGAPAGGGAARRVPPLTPMTAPRQPSRPRPGTFLPRPGRAAAAGPPRRPPRKAAGQEGAGPGVTPLRPAGPPPPPLPRLPQHRTVRRPVLPAVRRGARFPPSAFR